jgi:peptidoglycan-associated lipoprotein
VRFDFDSAAISEEEQKKLEGNADWMKKYATVNIVIEGHCDQRGSNEYNLSLGERRANAVKQALVNMGVAASRITTSSFGEEKPLANGDSEAEMSQNRRANFVPTK